LGLTVDEVAQERGLTLKHGEAACRSVAAAAPAGCGGCCAGASKQSHQRRGGRAAMVRFREGWREGWKED
jgi:hypothetical protein